MLPSKTAGSNPSSSLIAGTKDSSMPSRPRAGGAARTLKRRWGFFALLCMVTTLFLSALRGQSEELDANRSLASLLRQGRALRLGEARVVFQRCESAKGPTASCEGLGEKRFAFPSPGDIEAAVLAAPRRPNRATVEFALGPEERAFLKGRRQAALVFVRSVQEKVRGLYDGAPAPVKGIGQNAVLSFPVKDALARGSLRVQFDFPGLTWFGPAEVPAVLTDLESVDALTSIPLKLTFASRLSWQLELGFPLLLAAVGLVLDHSRVFGFACVYAAARALRTFLNIMVSEGSLDAFGREGLFLYATAGLCVPLFLLFVRAMGGHGTPRWKFDAPFAVAWVVAFVVASKLDPDFVMTSDLWSDGLASVLGMAMLGYTFGRTAWRSLAGRRLGRAHGNSAAGGSSGAGSSEKGDDGEKGGERALSRARDLLRIPARVKRVPAAALFVGLALTAYVNLAEMAAFYGQGFKNPLDWRHVALFPFLLTTALFEVGSTSRRIAQVAREIEEKTRLDDALRIAESVHGRMLPARTGRLAAAPGGSWRAFYRPAHTLGGDWFDVRELDARIPGDDGDERRVPFVVGCVVDLTGHGIGPSLAASALCSHWREFWAGASTPVLATGDAGACAAALGEAALRMHQALCSLSSEETATACLFALREDGLCYLTCGHPGFLLQAPDAGVRYLYTRCGGLGADRDRYLSARAFPAAFLPFAAGASARGEVPVSAPASVPASVPTSAPSSVPASSPLPGPAFVPNLVPLSAPNATPDAVAPSKAAIARRARPHDDAWVLCAVSDGFCRSPDGVTTWAHRLARKCARAGAPVAVALATELRIALREERLRGDAARAAPLPAQRTDAAAQGDGPDDVDDKTLLVVTLPRACVREAGLPVDSPAATGRAS